MIRARYRREGGIHVLTLSGHAGYAERGADIVCAAVSATAYNLLGWLENHSEELEFIQSHVGSGGVEITCEGGEDAAVAFDLTVTGLEQIAYKYPENMVVEYMSR